MKQSAPISLLGIAILMLSVMLSPAVAQDRFSSAPVRLVMGFPPGSTGDVIGRLVAQKISAQMNVNVIVDNKAGASGNIGADFVAKATPDGHTLLFNTPSQILSPAAGETLNYDVFKDLAPVVRVASSPGVLFVHPSVAANSPAEFIALVKANPDKLAYSSSGALSINRLGLVLVMHSHGLSALHVPYKGGAFAINDVVGGRIQFSMQSQTPLVPLVKDKRIKALAIASLKRSVLLPDVPTFAETVMPGFEIGTWNGVMTPAKTPAAIVKKLNNEILRAMQDPELASRIAQEGAELRGSTPQEYGIYLRNEFERWAKVIKNAGIKLSD